MSTLLARLEAVIEESERAAIERECERLVVAYTHHVDFGEAGRVAELFTPDGVWESSDLRLEGQEQIRERFSRRQDSSKRVSRHVCSNLAVQPVNESQAEGVVYLTLYRDDGDPDQLPRPLAGPYLVGHYRDRFVRTNAGWRFAFRRVDVAFIRATDRSS